MELTINVPGLKELAEALNNLAGVKTPLTQQGTRFQAPVSAPADASPQKAAPVSAAAPIQNQAPAVTPAPQPVPVSAPTQQPGAPITPVVTVSSRIYTADELARAAMTLMDAGKQPQLIQLLNSFGVDSLPALSSEQYGAFATALRGLGAQI